MQIAEDYLKKAFCPVVDWDKLDLLNWQTLREKCMET